MLRRNFFAIMLLLLALPIAAARADEVVLLNGDRVTGIVTGINDGKITIEQTKFGTISVSLSDVKSVTPASATQPATTQPTTAPSTQASTQPTTQPASSQPSTQPTSQPGVIAAKPPVPPPTAPAAAPPPKAPPIKRWSGAVTATGLATRGNSDTESVRISIDALRKGDKNTLTLATAYALGQSENTTTGEKTTNIDNWFTQAKLDYAFNEKWYNYALVRVEEDRIAHLDLRVSPGLGVGYRYLNKPDSHLNLEGGVNYVWESFENDGTNEHVALRMAYHYDKKLNDKVSLVHNVEYLPSVEAIDDFNINADLGIRAQLTTNLFSEFKVEWRYDSSPAPGAEDNDFRYTVGVGWKF